MRVVHEGRGGYIEIEGRRYPIEMHAGGRFSIHLTGTGPHRRHDEHALRDLVQREPDKWAIEARAPRRSNR